MVIQLYKILLINIKETNIKGFNKFSLKNDTFII